MFLWSARTLADALREHLPVTASLLEEIAATFGTSKFAGAFRKQYPKCENISVDYAVLEPRSAKGEQAGNIFCLPADFGWKSRRSGFLDGTARASHVERAARRKAIWSRVLAFFLLHASGNLIFMLQRSLSHSSA